MDPGNVKVWIDLAIGIVTLVAVLVGGLWAYTKFVVERGLLAPVEFTIDCNTLGEQRGWRLLEILLHLKNVGSSTLVAKDLEARVRYIKSEEKIIVFPDKKKATFGRVDFPHLLTRNLPEDKKDIKSTIPENKQDIKSTIPIVAHDTFVQPKVDQVYTLVTAVPQSASFVLVWAQFRYVKRPSIMQWATIKLSRRLGLIHYSLDHVKKPHTVERAFKLTGPDSHKIAT